MLVQMYFSSVGYGNPVPRIAIVISISVWIMLNMSDKTGGNLISFGKEANSEKFCGTCLFDDYVRNKKSLLPKENRMIVFL